MKNKPPLAFAPHTPAMSLLVALLLAILMAIGLSGCQQSTEGKKIESLAKTLTDSLTAVTTERTHAAEEAKSSVQASSGGGTSQVTDKSMTGIPDVISTLTSDDGNVLVLVNKLYTVSESYYPTDMVAVDNSLSTNKNLYFKREAYNAYLRMLEDAKSAGLSFCICSTYRSYALQKSLFNNSLAQNGAAFTYTRSAYPGRSEHHTGWAVDVTSASMGYGLSQNFVNYPEGLWINNHCQEYGFIIRYPKGKTHITGYDYEPWHLRYVGVDVATEIMSRGITLEEYLGKA